MGSRKRVFILFSFVEVFIKRNFILFLFIKVVILFISFYLTAAGEPTSNSTSSPTHEVSVFWQLSVSAWYLFSLVGIFILTALCHPTEAGCLIHGIWYLLCLPSGYLFLIIYSICNLTDRSWGKVDHGNG